MKSLASEGRWVIPMDGASTGRRGRAADGLANRVIPGRMVQEKEEGFKK